MTALLTAVIAVGVLAGCSEKTGGTAGTTLTTGGGQTSTAPTSESSSSGLSIAKFADKPCDLLTEAQVAKLGEVAAPKTSTSTLGPKCTWEGKDILKNSTYVVYATVDQDVEAMVDRVKTNPIFTEKKIGDVRVFINDSTDGVIHCRAIIEVSKTDSATVDADIAAEERAAKPACTEAESVAAMVIETLKG
ncbi:Protein of unknown function [Lentzea fradiae]|uniref:DUF3558 domain-containing protein n=1 Tax=Lentzea fradiae TaxID=200378 RepID=A0A1G7SBZ2_9PSEU|nr:DUF3558 family protein [Lentzea fradiae]SDG20585.1 Protein of unknown function [Lentzea fradiae]